MTKIGKVSKNQVSTIPYSVVFIRNGNELLFIKFPTLKNYWPGVYNGLGGPIEPWEDLEESAIRKVYEESGIKLKSLDLRIIINADDYFNRNRLLFFFIGNSPTKKIEGGRDLIWLPLDK